MSTLINRKIIVINFPCTEVIFLVRYVYLFARLFVLLCVKFVCENCTSGWVVTSDYILGELRDQKLYLNAKSQYIKI